MNLNEEKLKISLKKLLILSIIISILSGFVFFKLMDIPFGVLFNISFFFFIISILTILFLLTLLCIKSQKIVLKLTGIFPALLFLIITFAIIITMVDARMFVFQSIVPELTSKQWQEDLNYLAETMEEIHPALKNEELYNQFNTLVKKIESDIPEKTENEITMEFFRLCAFVNDAHSIPLFFVPNFNLHAYPIRIYKFDDGWYITSAGRSHQHLIGAKLIKIGSMNIDDIFQRVQPFFSAESFSSQLERFTYLMLTPEWLKTQGIINDINEVEFTFENEKQESFIKKISPVYYFNYFYWRDMKVIENDMPIVFVNPRKEAYKLESRHEGKTLYIKCNAV